VTVSGIDLVSSEIQFIFSGRGFFFFFIVVLGGGTLWHLQRFLKCIKYIILEFPPWEKGFLIIAFLLQDLTLVRLGNFKQIPMPSRDRKGQEKVRETFFFVLF
jgi:hypothetical protein